MRCDFSKEQLIAYLYAELSETEYAQVETHARTCRTCKRVLARLQETSRLLRLSADEVPDFNLTFPAVSAPRASPGSSASFRTRGWRRLGPGVMVGLAVVLIILVLVNLRATYEQGNLTLQFGLRPPSERRADSLPESSATPVTREEFDLWKEDAYQDLRQLIQELDERQRQESRAALTRLARKFERQRRQDLHWVGRGLETFQLSNRHRLQRTNEALQRLMQVSQRPDAGRDNK
ncbi:MAG: zf-HC2 domain-containing protein [bacterium]